MFFKCKIRELFPKINKRPPPLLFWTQEYIVGSKNMWIVFLRKLFNHQFHRENWEMAQNSKMRCLKILINKPSFSYSGLTIEY